MRVIAGSKKGMRITAPPGEETRPTTDKVREAIFGSIQFDISGARVLDLFAGSGAMGVEALSRGADECVFC
ncbi:MAG: RsmD family RNA methyltransferase, partial [Christensenellaceae bacterium]